MDQGKYINNRYQLIEKLGQGGMGVVYKAYDRLEKQHVALKKVLLPEKDIDFASKAGTDDTDKLRLSLAREFSILATLRHPHILSVLDFGFDEDKHPFYTMTLLEGGQDVKSYATNISRGRRIRLLGQMLQALHYLHRRGVLHRDLKPDNVFVTHDEQIKVMDFGLAQLDKVQSAESADSMVGTINYMAPEQFLGESASVASDLHAVGVMVYEIMVGQHPFEAKSIGDRIIKIMTHTPDLSAIPDNFAPWLKKVLDKEPAKRFANAYDAMIEFYKVFGREVPAEDQIIRESFLQSSTFVGRAAEFKQLTDALDVIHMQNAFFLIGGESGVGKSRLSDEFRIHALVNGAIVLRGQAAEGGGLPFQMWRNIARRLLLMVDVTDLQDGILKDLVPDVGELLGRDIPDAPELTGKAYQERIIATIVDLLRQVQQPTVLLLEDLQWAVESLEPLKQILLVKDQLHRLIIVANYRDDEAPELPDTLPDMTPIKLARLDETAVRKLSASILGERGTRPELVQMIQQQSEGNTFFIIETVRALAEELGSLEKISTAQLPPAIFTSSMQQLMQRRLSQVDAQYNEIQKLASVIGREVDLKLLHHRFDESRVQAWLIDASNAAVLEVQDNTWRFSHDKLRETVLAGIPDAELPTLHRTAAEAIEVVYADDNAYNEALLQHWNIAGDLDKELHYLYLVLNRMMYIQGAHAAVIERVEEVRKRLSADDVRTVWLLSLLSNIYNRQNLNSEALQLAEMARDIAIAAGDMEMLALSLFHLANVIMDLGNFQRATEYLQQSLQNSQPTSNQGRVGNALHNLGISALMLGDFAQATEYIRQSMQIAQKANNQEAISRNLRSLADIALHQGDYPRAIDLTQQSLRIAQEMGNPGTTATCFRLLGNIARYEGNAAQSIEYYQQALAIHTRYGDPIAAANCYEGLGLIAQSQGAHEQARDYFQQSFAIRIRGGLHLSAAMALNNLGWNAENMREYERASELYQGALAISEAVGSRTQTAFTLASIGFLTLKQKGNAAHWFQRGLRIAQEIAAYPTMMIHIAGLAGQLTAQGQYARAAQFAGFAQHHPATNSDITEVLSLVLPQLQAALPPDELAAALERGKQLNLDSVVQELLGEFAVDKQIAALMAEGSTLDLETTAREWLARLEDEEAEDTASEGVPEDGREPLPAAPAPDQLASSAPESDPARNVKLLLEHAQAAADPKAMLRLVAVAHVLAAAHKLDVPDASADTVKALAQLETSLGGGVVQRALDELTTVNIDQLVRNLIHPPASKVDEDT